MEVQMGAFSGNRDGGGAVITVKTPCSPNVLIHFGCFKHYYHNENITLYYSLR